MTDCHRRMMGGGRVCRNALVLTLVFGLLASTAASSANAPAPAQRRRGRVNAPAPRGELAQERWVE
ncbi:MAG: hypothetical protein LC747_08505, partial [Acidobacteria bacterium]|nr:hypothetical protein [Acidobacteriota bacterium]